MLTKIFVDKVNGHPFITIKEVDDRGQTFLEFDRKTGEKKEAKAIIKFGLRKAKAIFDNIEHIKEFIEDNK